MHNFVVIDHSVKRIGGHNYEYAYHILRAAEVQGYRPILAVNRRFFEKKRLPLAWMLYTPYRHTTYEGPALVEKQRRLAAGRKRLIQRHSSEPFWARAASYLPSPLKRWLIRRYDAKQLAIIDQFAADTATLFRQLKLTSGDQIFVPTLSQDDLVGLIRFFRAEPAAAAVDWHLQFHFKVFNGREPEYASQESRLGALKQLFRDAATALAGDRVHFYTTTEHLATQYNRLGAARFETLPYPVNPGLLDRQRCKTDDGSPLRVTSAGGVRAEKGTAQLYRAVAPLWDEYFDAGRLQLVVQAKRLGKLPPELRSHAKWDRSLDRPTTPGTNVPKVAVVRWPLSTERYLDLVQNSHIGLLLYDADQYYVRCSGVMVEMLKAGVPVLVPAGCWMADQIAEPIFVYRDEVMRQFPRVIRLPASAASWEDGGEQRLHAVGAAQSFQVGRGTSSLVCHIRVPGGASHLCLRFRWSPSAARGSYLDLLVMQTPDGKRQLATHREIVGQRGENRAVPILVPLVGGAQQLQLVWRNAYQDQVVKIDDVEFVFLGAEQANSGATGLSSSVPLGAVGLTFAGVEQVPALLRDMVDHYDHYRRTAEAFAPAWGEWHSPERVVRLLTDRAKLVAEHETRVLQFDLPQRRSA